MGHEENRDISQKGTNRKIHKHKPVEHLGKKHDDRKAIVSLPLPPQLERSELDVDVEPLDARHRHDGGEGHLEVVRVIDVVVPPMLDEN